MEDADEFLNHQDELLTDNFHPLSESTKVILHKWQKIVQNKHKNEDYKDDKLFQDPLLLVEWDNAGILAKTTINAQFIKEALITCMYINITSQNLLCETLYSFNLFYFFY